MNEYLCLIKQDEDRDWYILCVRETFYCIACGTLKTIIRAIKNLKEKYKTAFRLNEALLSMSESCKPNQITFNLYSALYEESKGQHDYIIRDTLKGLKQSKGPKRLKGLNPKGNFTQTAERAKPLIQSKGLTESKPLLIKPKGHYNKKPFLIQRAITKSKGLMQSKGLADKEGINKIGGAKFITRSLVKNKNILRAELY